MLKYVLKFDCLFTLLVLAVPKENVVDFFLIMQPFLYLEGALKLISLEQF